MIIQLKRKHHNRNFSAGLSDKRNIFFRSAGKVREVAIGIS